MNVWIPPLNADDYTKAPFWQSGMLYQYLTVFYYMVVCFGGNELSPRTPFECGYIVFCMIAAAIVNANLFGEMSLLITVITRK
jgi:hypothetical protein